MLYVKRLLSYLNDDQYILVETKGKTVIYEGLKSGFINKFKDEYYVHCSINNLFTDCDILVIKLNN